jgi:hypothetical protein
MHPFVKGAVVLAAVGAGLAIQRPQRESERAVEEYMLVARYGTMEEQCGSAQKVASAYLAERDVARYRFWSAKSRLDCYYDGHPPDS